MWAANNFAALKTYHEQTPPTHWLTLMFNKHETTDQIRHFHATINQNLRNYNNRHQDKNLAFWAVAEPCEDETVHYHIFARAEGIDPQNWFTRQAEKYNQNYGTEITIPYQETPQNHLATLAYSLKLNHEWVRLFKSNSLPRYTWTAGKYFDGHKVSDLRKANRAAWARITIASEDDQQAYEWEQWCDANCYEWVRTTSSPEPSQALLPNKFIDWTAAHPIRGFVQQQFKKWNFLKWIRYRGMPP